MNGRALSERPFTPEQVAEILDFAPPPKAGPSLCRGHFSAFSEKVYFVRSGQFVKIGTTKCISSRLSNLVACNPEPLELLTTLDGGKCVEREWHQRFVKQRVRGEWFRYEGALLEAIVRLRHGR